MSSRVAGVQIPDFLKKSGIYDLLRVTMSPNCHRAVFVGSSKS
ncbi:hypothetical protein [Trichormus variabilis]|nr:hypothetical protein [Trichormus variabilis]